ncbi:MAG: DUF6465 family protein [Lachnospiraceae bacterium]|nr:DUF6465 family protein [Lachnospiraceae bacterium]
MAATKKESVDTTITKEEVVNAETKKADAKAATAAARAAGREAVKKNAEAAAATVKDATVNTVEKTKSATKKAADKTKKNVEKAVSSTKKAVKESAETTKRKYTRKPVKNIVIQYLGEEISEEVLTERALAQFAATEGAVSVKSITLYIKPEDKAAYYVINDQYRGCIEF